MRKTKEKKFNDALKKAIKTGEVQKVDVTPFDSNPIFISIVKILNARTYQSNFEIRYFLEHKNGKDEMTEQEARDFIKNN